MAKLAFHMGPYGTLGDYVATELEIQTDNDVLYETFEDMASKELMALTLDSFVGVKCVCLMSRAQTLLDMLDDSDRVEVAQRVVSTMMIWLHG